MKKKNNWIEKLTAVCSLLHLLVAIAAGVAGAFLLGNVFGMGAGGYALGFLLGVGIVGGVVSFW